jgi:hypothetical protein
MRRIDLKSLALDARGVVYVQSREERDKLHAYLSKSVGGGESGRRVSSSGALRTVLCHVKACRPAS